MAYWQSEKMVKLGGGSSSPGGWGLLRMWSISHWDLALGAFATSGREDVVLSIILTARVMPAISVLMFVTRRPASAPTIMEGVRPSSERREGGRGTFKGSVEGGVEMEAWGWGRARGWRGRVRGSSIW